MNLHAVLCFAIGSAHFAAFFAAFPDGPKSAFLAVWTLFWFGMAARYALRGTR